MQNVEKYMLNPWEFVGKLSIKVANWYRFFYFNYHITGKDKENPSIGMRFCWDD